jgi:hypothetical protein
LVIEEEANKMLALAAFGDGRRWCRCVQDSTNRCALTDFGRSGEISALMGSNNANGEFEMQVHMTVPGHIDSRCCLSGAVEINEG